MTGVYDNLVISWKEARGEGDYYEGEPVNMDQDLDDGYSDENGHKCKHFQREPIVRKGVTYRWRTNCKKRGDWHRLCLRARRARLVRASISTTTFDCCGNRLEGLVAVYVPEEDDGVIIRLMHYYTAVGYKRPRNIRDLLTS